jgi:hypothetical protein
MLERALLIVTANQWAKGTLTTYQSKFRVISDFERSFRLPVLQPTGLRYPSNGPAIRLMWVQERYSLYPAEWSKKSSLLAESVKFSTVRGLCSAASHFCIWDLLHANPEKLTLGFKDRPTIVESCSPTDEVAYTLTVIS